MGNLGLRLATAAIALPLLGLAVFLGGWTFAVVAGLLAGIAILEFVHGFLFPSLPIRQAVSHLPIALVGGVAVASAVATPGVAVAAAVLAAGLIAAGYLPTNRLGPRRPFRVQGAALVYIALPAAAIVLLRGLDDGREWLLLALLATFAVDTGAYAVGRLIGRHKLAPRISPAKTWEGAGGGYLGGAAAVAGMVAWFSVDGGSGRTVVLALALPPVAILGDLFESWLKRKMGVKDASGLLPGHGGLLDRLDSALPVGVLVYAVALTA